MAIRPVVETKVMNARIELRPAALAELRSNLRNCLREAGLVDSEIKRNPPKYSLGLPSQDYNYFIAKELIKRC